MTNATSMFQHYDMQSTIRGTGRRVESAIHSGMLSLATAQAAAMEKLGTRIDDRLVQIDERLLDQTRELNLVRSGLGRMHSMLAESFGALALRMSELEDRLARIEDLTSNPERARAFERFRRAMGFYDKGDFPRALEAVDFAIGNDGGPTFDEIPEFHALRGQILSGSRPHPENERLVDPAAAHYAFATAARHTRPYRERGPLHMAAGAMAVRAGLFAEAHASYREAVRDLWTVEAHFAAARTALVVGEIDSAREQLLEALKSDWSVIVSAAADPVCIAHADLVEPILKEYVTAEKKRITEGLEALCDMLAGPALQNLDVARARLSEAGNTLHREIATCPQRDRMLNDEERQALLDLLDPELGLLDIRDDLRKINRARGSCGDRAIETALTLIHTAWERTWNNLEDIAKAAGEGRIHHRVGLPLPPMQYIPPRIETHGLRGKLGMQSPEARQRAAEIAKAEAHNEKVAPVIADSKKKMKEVFMPALNDARRVAHRTLKMHPVARQIFIDACQDEALSERMKNRAARKDGALLV